MTDEAGWQRIRPVALGVPTRDDGDELLLSRHVDPETGEPFYRAVGGGIDFGELSEDAVVREFREELDVTATVTGEIATLERTFEFDGEPGHEIWFLYAVDLAEDWPYERDEFTAYEPHHDEEFAVEWMARDDLRRNDVTVYCEELPELLA
jgi:ADP-ribose pyrophosphatase YjhB (NUDIX family)